MPTTYETAPRAYFSLPYFLLFVSQPLLFFVFSTKLANETEERFTQSN